MAGALPLARGLRTAPLLFRVPVAKREVEMMVKRRRARRRIVMWCVVKGLRGGEGLIGGVSSRCDM